MGLFLYGAQKITLYYNRLIRNCAQLQATGVFM